MATFHVHSSMIWVGMSLLMYWNFSVYLFSFSLLIAWLVAVAALSTMVRCILHALEWVCGVSAHSMQRLSTDPSNRSLEHKELGWMFNLFLLIYFTGAAATAAWRDALFAIIILSSWAARVEWQAEWWGHHPDWRFRIFALTSCCLALVCATLQWSFFATSLSPTDEANGTVYYVVTVWSATLVIHLLQSLIFEVLHILYATTWVPGRSGGGEFDPMEEVGLTVRSVGALLSVLLAMLYCPHHVVVLMQLTVVRFLFGMINAFTMLQRFNGILRPFPELSTTGYCVICLESVKTSEGARKLHCGHIFHGRCLRRWLMRADHCPTCRRPTQEQHEDGIASVGFGVERQRVRRQSVHSSRDTAVQTTFGLEYNLRPTSVHGSLRPLTRSTNQIVEAARAFADVSSENGVVGNSRSTNDDNERSSRLAVGMHQMAAVPLPHRQPLETRAPSAFSSVPAVAEFAPALPVEPDEFADKPIWQTKGTALRRRRRSAIARGGNVATEATPGAERSEGDGAEGSEEREKGDQNGEVTGPPGGTTAPPKRMRLEAAAADPGVRR